MSTQATDKHRRGLDVTWASMRWLVFLLIVSCPHVLTGHRQTQTRLRGDVQKLEMEAHKLEKK